jgi:hypothetical protein
MIRRVVGACLIVTRPFNGDVFFVRAITVLSPQPRTTDY